MFKGFRQRTGFSYGLKLGLKGKPTIHPSAAWLVQSLAPH